MSIQSNPALLQKIQEMIPLEYANKCFEDGGFEDSYKKMINGIAGTLSDIYKKAVFKGGDFSTEEPSIHNLSTISWVLHDHRLIASVMGVFKLLNIKCTNTFTRTLKQHIENNQAVKHSPYSNYYKLRQDILKSNFNDQNLVSFKEIMSCLPQESARRLGLPDSTVLCQSISTFTWDPQNPCMSLISPEIPSPQIPDFLTKQNSYRKSGQYTDAILVVQGREFPVHKTILRSKLDVFDGLLGDKFAESCLKTIDLSKEYPELQADVFEHFLEFTYTEHISFKNLSLQEIVDLHQCAHYFGSKELEKRCIGQLKGKLTRETFWDIFDVAFRIKDRSLDKQLKLFMYAHLEWLEKEFNDLSGYSVEDLLDWINQCNYFELTKSIPKLKEEIQRKIDLACFDTVCQAAAKDDDLKKICSEFVHQNQFEFDRDASPEVKSRFVKLMLGITV